jgi:hypothetical protein
MEFSFSFIVPNKKRNIHTDVIKFIQGCYAPPKESERGMLIEEIRIVRVLV